ncbi:hypothetical protein KCP77_20565 [Salmonella enterica subsp. enterica]|nr:hypothetical protein KCP77_20565 [Salmonella enterica subsp. enterica]
MVSQRSGDCRCGTVIINPCSSARGCPDAGRIPRTTTELIKPLGASVRSADECNSAGTQTFASVSNGWMRRLIWRAASMRILPTSLRPADQTPLSRDTIKSIAHLLIGLVRRGDAPEWRRLLAGQHCRHQHHRMTCMIPVIPHCVSKDTVVERLTNFLPFAYLRNFNTE